MEAEIQSTNLEMRTLQPEKDDFADYLSWMQDKAANLFIQGANPKTILSDLQKYVQEKNDSSEALLLGIFEKTTKIHIGNIKLEPIRPKRDACLGILIGNPGMRGKGYGFEAISLIAHFSRREFLLDSIYLGVDTMNKPAINLYKKMNFKFEDSGNSNTSSLQMRLDLTSI